jgi:hypothetical protein
LFLLFKLYERKLELILVAKQEKIISTLIEDYAEVSKNKIPRESAYYFPSSKLTYLL